MRLNAPTKIIFLVSLILVAVAVISQLVAIPQIPQLRPNALWIAVLGYVVLVLGVTMKGL